MLAGSAVAGATTASTGTGAVATAGVVYSWDMANAGYQTMMNGKHYDTGFVNFLQTTLGMSPEAATFTDGLVATLLGAGIAKSTNTAVSGVRYPNNINPNLVPKTNTPSASTTIIYDKTEIKTPHTIKSSDAVTDWNNYLGPNQTNINPATGLPELDRIFSADGTRSIRLTGHEMRSLGTSKGHYHRETWSYNSVTDTMTVTNENQRITFQPQLKK